MEIVIDGKYRIRQDSYQFILEELTVVSKEGSKNFGQEKWITLGFFTKIPHIITFLMKLEISSETISSFQQVSDKIDKFGEACLKAFNQQKGE